MAALDVAKYLIKLSSPDESEDNDRLCNLRLQKLLYYVQGWHLATFGKPLFPERIEAWRHGPVVRDVYHTFARFGFSIPPSEGSVPEGMGMKDKQFIERVWMRYRNCSATALRDMTHKEAPWLVTRGHLPPDARCDREIETSVMRDYFSVKLYELLHKQDSRIRMDVWAESAKAIAGGNTKSVSEIRRDLRSRAAETHAR
jgi:uncharacterized phage-associated protein